MRFKKGFTIIELMLAMTALSFLLLSIVFLTMQVSESYRKGATLRELNAASRSINDSLTRTFNSMSSFSWGDVKTSRQAGANYVQNADGGVFCTGIYSYIWNSAAMLNRTDSNKNVMFKYSDVLSDRANSDLRFVRVSDPGMRYCSDSNAPILRPNQIGSTTVELLASSETSLMLYDILFYSNDRMLDLSTDQRMVNISYVLGTKNDGKVNVINNNCTGGTGDESYCAINKFDLTVRTLGRR